jgi:hypothetical protein
VRSEVQILSPRPQPTWDCPNAYHVGFASSSGSSSPTRFHNSTSRTIPEQVARSQYLTLPPEADRGRSPQTDLPGALRSAGAPKPGGSYSALQPQTPCNGRPACSAEAIGRDVSALLKAGSQARHHLRGNATSSRLNSLPFPLPGGILSKLAEKRFSLNPQLVALHQASGPDPRSRPRLRQEKTTSDDAT